MRSTKRNAGWSSWDMKMSDCCSLRCLLCVLFVASTINTGQRTDIRIYHMCCGGCRGTLRGDHVTRHVITK